MKFPFDEPENTAVITCNHILENGADILYVSHDKDDGMWQFLCGGIHLPEDARIVSLYEMFCIDKTLSKISDMPCGYVAERKTKNTDWILKTKA